MAKSKSKKQQAPRTPSNQTAAGSTAGSLIWAGVAIIVLAIVAAWYFADAEPAYSSPTRRSSKASAATGAPDIDGRLPVRDVLTRIPTIEGLNYTLLNKVSWRRPSATELGVVAGTTYLLVPKLSGRR